MEQAKEAVQAVQVEICNETPHLLMVDFLLSTINASFGYQYIRPDGGTITIQNADNLAMLKVVPAGYRTLLQLRVLTLGFAAAPDLAADFHKQVSKDRKNIRLKVRLSGQSNNSWLSAFAGEVMPYTFHWEELTYRTLDEIAALRSLFFDAKQARSAYTILGIAFTEGKDEARKAYDAKQKEFQDKINAATERKQIEKYSHALMLLKAALDTFNEDDKNRMERFQACVNRLLGDPSR